MKLAARLGLVAVLFSGAAALSQPVTIASLKAALVAASSKLPSKKIADLVAQIATGTTPPVTVVTAPSPTPVPAPIVTPTPYPPSAIPPAQLATLIAPAISGLAAIDDGLDFAALTGPNRIPGKMNDIVGAFRFLCKPSHNAYDDPIVYPGQPGASPHLHTFFGNTRANGNSTYASLRTTGDSTCMNALNRSAYWIPSMMNGLGQVVMPDNVSIYYKQRPASSPECAQLAPGGCIGLPRGLRFVFGYNMGTGALGNGHWDCPGKNGDFSTIAEAAKGCTSNQLAGTIDTPMCWNGRDLDSADHRSHLSYPSYGNWGYPKCPATHPYVIPQFVLTVNYTTDSSLPRDGSEGWYLSSDRMAGMPRLPAGLSFHGDWFGAWNDRAQAMWQSNCIDKLLDGVDGDLCGGLILNRNAYYPSGVANPRLVPVPARS